jgi:hypothetical protein
MQHISRIIGVMSLLLLTVAVVSPASESIGDGRVAISASLISAERPEPPISQPDADALRQLLNTMAQERGAFVAQLDIQGEWATAALVQQQDGRILTGEGSIVIARWNSRLWDIAIEGSHKFRAILWSVPDSLISPGRKVDLDYENAEPVEGESVAATSQ